MRDTEILKKIQDYHNKIMHAFVITLSTIQVALIFFSQGKTPHDLAVENKNIYDADLILMARQRTNPQGMKEYLTRDPVSRYKIKVQCSYVFEIIVAV